MCFLPKFSFSSGCAGFGFMASRRPQLRTGLSHLVNTNELNVFVFKSRKEAYFIKNFLKRNSRNKLGEILLLSLLFLFCFCGAVQPRIVVP